MDQKHLRFIEMRCKGTEKVAIIKEKSLQSWL